MNNACGTFTSDTISIIEIPLPSIFVSADQNISCDSSVTLSASGADYFQWNPVTGLSDPMISNPVAQPTLTTTYTITGTDTNGCSASDSITITVLCDSLEVPGGISPNGDGNNDYFVIKRLSDFPGNQLEIFNRWGNLVYRKEEYDNSWNGFSNVDYVKLGTDLTDGTYYYVLDLNNGKVFTGYVVIRR